MEERGYPESKHRRWVCSAIEERQIEAERELVKANRKLIEIFEWKIQAKLAEICGEEKADSSVC